MTPLLWGVLPVAVLLWGPWILALLAVPLDRVAGWLYVRALGCAFRVWWLCLWAGIILWGLPRWLWVRWGNVGR